MLVIMGEEKMKIAIITITDGANYGNRLQNYSLQQTLEKIGYQVETLRHNTSSKVPLIHIPGFCLGQIFLFFFGDRTGFLYNIIRKIRFRKFDKSYIKFGKDKLGFNKASSALNEKYDLFVCGSDQIWNVNFNTIEEDIKNYLAFFAPSSKKISYAASFGTEYISEKYKKIFKQGLSEFKDILVREETGVELVNQICGREAKVVLDPTMLLTAEEWMKISKKPKYCSNEKFIVTYMLGGRNEHFNIYVQEVKQRYKVDRIINLDIEYIKDCDIENKNEFFTEPSEFIWLIANAECVLTDSFHATVFSILFHRPFCVFERNSEKKSESMESRIDTLLRKFDLEMFRCDLKQKKVFPCKFDSEKVDDILEKERNQSINYLKNAIRKE